MQTGLVSIIIPTYNRAHLVADAIRSVLTQDYPYKQLIIIDDGSTDDTRRVVSSFAEVEYYYQDNQGQAAARNAGLRRCRGEYIASLDSDDIWDPTFLSSGLRQMQPEVNLVFMNWQVSNSHNGLEIFFQRAAARRRYFTRAVGDWWHLDAAQSRRLMLETCPAPSSALIIRRSAMPESWNEQMLIADDWCLLLDIVMNQPTTVLFTMVPHWLKRVHGENIYDGRDYVAVAEELSSHDEPLLLLRYRSQLSRREVVIFRQRQAEHHVNYAYNSYKVRDKAALLRHMATAFQLAPLATGWRIAHEVLNYGRTYFAKTPIKIPARRYAPSA
ncbi:glycosyltransferase family 2 protein [Hymenobacter negativus]|uniref:Glycosyltransferase family 2 protein n=1 Tax=Hymenobacter negativus TaxID=2795026 RepID=A0ABS3Q9F8_9BACT|nr:glycosyltransferase family A protein [Hymenobacter negativus]MBO2007777.1 glycosyltransferase family 2 protein [Hymenobacter negativus]